MPNLAQMRDEPITLARVERALDRLAVIMTERPDKARALLAWFETLEQEAEALRSQDDVLAAVRARATRLRDRTAEQSS